MLRATHLSVGVAAALAVLQPDNLFECLAVTGIAAVGSVISDIDADQSKVRREADLMLGIGAAVLAAVMIAQTRFHVDLTKYLSGNQTLSERSVTAGVFIILCVIGKMTPHRSFMHSIMAMAILSAAISMVSVKLVLYFVVGFVSHLVLDCFNRKRVRILYPLPGGIALDFCKAGGFVDSLLFKLGSVAVIFEIVYLAVQMGESWKLFRM